MSTIEVTIERMIPGGLGLGQVEGKRALVPLTAPGERVRVVPTEEHAHYFKAALVEVLEPHPSRRDPPCPYFGACGGCDFQYLPHEEQLPVKRAMVLDAFRRIGKMDVDGVLQTPAPVCSEFGYRNRIRLSYGLGGQVGLVRRASNKVVAVEACLLMPEAWNRHAMPWLRTLPSAEKASFRLDTQDRALVAITGPRWLKSRLVKRLAAMETDEVPFPGALGVSLSARTLWGGSHMEIELAGGRFRVSAGSFFQVNYRGAEGLIDAVNRTVGDSSGGTLIDLYAGVGTFAIALSSKFDRVIGVEIARSAVQDFKTNISWNSVSNVDLSEGPVAKVLPKIISDLEGDSDVTVLADPPRTGLEKGTVSNLIRLRPRHIIYVSCDPATLARDVALFTKENYTLESLEIIDLFPQTAHVECVARLDAPAQ